MIPRLEKVEKKTHESFRVGVYSDKYFERTWHFHSEYEFLMITNGHGYRVIGDQRHEFKKGDIVLVGANIPHAWFSAPSYLEPDNEELCESIYVQFDRAMFGTSFSGLPEMLPVRKILDEAEYGLVLSQNHPEIVRRMHKLPNCTKLDRILEFIKILELFQTAKHDKILSEDYFQKSFIIKSERVQKVHEFIINNYMNDIDLNSVAEMLEMNTSSFCRFFKSKTGRTFSQYVKEIRIDYAKQLLINTNLASYQVGFECGFSSIAYFNQSFKSVCDISPLEYREKFKLV